MAGVEGAVRPLRARLVLAGLSEALASAGSLQPEYLLVLAGKPNAAADTDPSQKWAVHAHSRHNRHSRIVR